MRALRGQKGVAMVTVLFVGAALTAVASVAAIGTVRELGSGRADRFGSEAVSYGDAGIDAMISHLRSGQVLYSDIYNAGCGGSPAGTSWLTTGMVLPNSSIGTTGGSFDVVLRVFNRAATQRSDWFGASACAARPVGTSGPLFIGILSTGNGPASAKRELLQVLRVTPSGLPVGHYAVNISVGGNLTMRGVSMISETTFTSRHQVAFIGNDPYYTIGDFWPSAADADTSRAMPAAAHAIGGITLKNNIPEFNSGVPNCNANDTRNQGVATQSLWDSDGSANTANADGSPKAITQGCNGQTGRPPHARFTSSDAKRIAPARLGDQEYRELQDAAQNFGLYCLITGSTSTTYCTIRNGPRFSPPTTWQDSNVASLVELGASRSFVAFFDYQNGQVATSSTNEVDWRAGNVWPCAVDANGVPTSLNRNGTIVVRNGGFTMASTSRLNGAVLAQDGIFKYAGGATVNGTILAKEITMSGNSEFSMDDCWVKTRAGSFSSITPVHWAEIDR